jgi:hypothetical protein
MAALTNQPVNESFEQVLHVDRDGGGNGTTLVDVKDGDNGTTFLLKLATDKVAAGDDFYMAVSAGGTSYFKLVTDVGSHVYAWIHYNGVSYEIRIQTSAPA